jgi:hypothetical protein
MPQSLTTIPSVITVENTDGHIPSIKFSREIIFGAFHCRCFFFFDRVNAERGITDDQYFIGDAVGKPFRLGLITMLIYTTLHNLFAN